MKVMRIGRMRVGWAACSAALLLSLAASADVWALGPSGFAGSGNAAPQAARTPASVEQILQTARDEDRVVVRGRITRHLEDDKYEFVDEAGKSIRVELDDDRDWSNIAKDQPIEIEAEVDRYKEWIKLEVKRADPL